MKLPRKHKSIYIYPNRFGFLFVGSFVLSVLLGATYENNMLFLFAFVQLGFIFVAILVTAAEIRAVEVLSINIGGGFPGEAAPIKLLLTNLSKNEVQFTVAGIGEPLDYKLRANQTQLFMKAMPLPGRRGSYALDRIRFFTSGPFLFFNCWKYWYLNHPYYVYPTPAGQSLPLRSTGVDIANVSGLEEYTGTQPISRISWRHFGRTGRLLIKAAESAGLDLFDFDAQKLQGLEHEAACAQLSKWICEAELAGIPYSLKLPHSASAAGIGPKHRDQQLTELAKWQA